MSWIDDMAAAAGDVAEAAGPDVRIPLGDPRRTDWTYVPSRRHGVKLAALDHRAGNLVHRLLAVALADEAYAQLCAIVSLEEVLDLLEGRTHGRHSGNYWVAIYGEPGADEWAWSFEGHHVSVNVAVAGGAVRPTPLFLGANPHEYAIRPLGWEEDYARAALSAMDTRERQAAIISDTAPDDIITATRVGVGDCELEPLGIRGGDVALGARRCLDALLRLYSHRVRTPPPGPPIEEVYFAWAGGSTPGQPHYYRLQGEGVLIEYDNTQDNANHSHTVWRVPGGDFGGDVLAAHRAEHHGSADSPSG